MKVVLLKDVASVGKAGELKEVADGFAQNFLLPRGMAQPATGQNVAVAEKISAENEKKKKEETKELQEMAKKIEGQKIVFKVKTEGDKLFGSIDKKMIAEEISKNDVKIDSSAVKLDAAIKEIGEFPVKISFAQGVESTVKVVIEKE